MCKFDPRRGIDRSRPSDLKRGAQVRSAYLWTRPQYWSLDRGLTAQTSNTPHLPGCIRSRSNGTDAIQPNRYSKRNLSHPFAHLRHMTFFLTLSSPVKPRRRRSLSRGEPPIAGIQARWFSARLMILSGPTLSQGTNELGRGFTHRSWQPDEATRGARRIYDDMGTTVRDYHRQHGNTATGCQWEPRRQLIEALRHSRKTPVEALAIVNNGGGKLGSAMEALWPGTTTRMSCEAPDEYGHEAPRLRIYTPKSPKQPRNPYGNAPTKGGARSSRRVERRLLWGGR
jgi:hypothetical protein